MRTIYYALMLLCMVLFIIVIALVIDAAITGHAIAWLLLPILCYFAWCLYEDALTINDDEDKL